MRDLGTLGGIDSFATAVNTNHTVIGGAQTGEPGPFFGQQVHPFLWRKGVITDLGTLGGPDGFAAGINEVGQVVGTDVDSATVPPFAGPTFFCLSLGRRQDDKPGSDGGNRKSRLRH